jgi:hypothetical protein
VLEVAVFEIVGKNFYPASQVVWSLGISQIIFHTTTG